MAPQTAVDPHTEVDYDTGHCLWMAAAAKHTVLTVSTLALAGSTLVLAGNTPVLHMHRCLAREGSAQAVLEVQVVGAALGTRRSCLHTAHFQIYVAGDNMPIQSSCGSRKGHPVQVRCEVQHVLLAEKSSGE